MATNFIYKAIFIIPAAQLSTANTLAMNLDPVGGANTFSTGINATGTKGSVASSYWVAPVLTQSCWDTIKGYIDGGQIPGCVYYKLNSKTSLLLDTNDSNATSSMGKNWNDCSTLDLLALKRITTAA